MSTLRRLVVKLLHTLRPSRGDQDAVREYEAHVALVEDELVRRGTARDEAHRTAKQVVGPATAVTAAHRDARGYPLLLDTVRDIRHAARMLRRAPAHTTAVLITVALMVTVAATMSAVLHGVLLSPLPYPVPDRLVRIWERHEGATPVFPGAYASDLTYRALVDAALPSIEDVGAFQHRSHTMSGPHGSEQLEGAGLTPSLPRLLRLTPSLGRFFLDDEASAGSRPVAVLGHRLWQRHFWAARDVLGKTIVLDSVGHEIIGVAPPTFVFPEADTDVYTPLDITRPEGNNLGMTSVIARLSSDATPERVAGEATNVARATDRPMVADVLFGKGGPVVVHVQRLDAQMTAAVRPALLTLGTAVLLLLVVACANVANLSVAHALGRRHELNIRMSLGATRLRLLRQVMVENLGLCLVGAGIGGCLGMLLLEALPRVLPESFPRLSAVRLHWSFLAAALLSALTIASLSAIAAVRELSRGGLATRDGGSRTVAAGRSRLRQGLLVVESALAVVLLIGAVLLLRSFAALMGVDAGYDPTQTVTATLHLPGSPPEADASASRTRRHALAENLLERLRAHPGVTVAGIGTVAPFGGSIARFGFELPGTSGPNGRPVIAYALYSAVTSGYIEALGMRVLDGRSLTLDDHAASTRAMLVNETFARTYFDDGRPVVGRQYEGMLGDDATVVEVVGVVADVLPVRLDAEPEAHIYLAAGGPFELRGMALVIRTSHPTGRVLEDIRAMVTSVDTDAAVDNLGPLETKLAASVATPRAIMLLLAGFSGLALVLAVAGLYGVLSHMVATRSRELGIRAALGARRRALIGMVVRQGLGVTIVGLLAGMAVAAMVVRVLQSQLFGVRPLDPVSFAVAPAILLVCALAACVLPARRAAAVDPADALRSPSP